MKKYTRKFRRRTKRVRRRRRTKSEPKGGMKSIKQLFSQFRTRPNTHNQCLHGRTNDLINPGPDASSDEKWCFAHSCNRAQQKICDNLDWTAARPAPFYTARRARTSPPPPSVADIRGAQQVAELRPWEVTAAAAEEEAEEEAEEKEEREDYVEPKRGMKSIKQLFSQFRTRPNTHNQCLHGRTNDLINPGPDASSDEKWCFAHSCNRAQQKICDNLDWTAARPAPFYTARRARTSPPPPSVADIRGAQQVAELRPWEVTAAAAEEEAEEEAEEKEEREDYVKRFATLTRRRKRGGRKRRRRSLRTGKH